MCRDQYSQLQRQYSGTIEDLETKFMTLGDKFSRMQTMRDRELIELREKVEELRAAERHLKMDKENRRRPRGVNKKKVKKEVLCPRCAKILRK